MRRRRRTCHLGDMVSITGFEQFGLSLRQVSALRNRIMKLYVHVKTSEVGRDVLARKPSEREAYRRARAERWVRQLHKRFNHLSFKRSPSPAVYPSFAVRANSRDLRNLAKHPAVRSVHVAGIEGYRKQWRKVKLGWFCVRARVAIQVESQLRGRQTIEDRFVLVRARSFADAEQRLSKKWHEYAHIYLNPSGYAVRWQIEKVTDVYNLMDDGDIDPDGTEVYSSLSERNMRPKYVWSPKNKKNA